MEDARETNQSCAIGEEDCSEAFDSIKDAPLDISFQAEGIADRLTEWYLQARRQQQRLVSAMGQVSDLDTALDVKGGAQGLPSTPFQWNKLKDKILRFSHLYGGSGYQYQVHYHGEYIRTALNKDEAYGDDKLPKDATKRGLATTAGASAAMCATMGIRNQHRKSLYIPTEITYAQALAAARHIQHHPATAEQTILDTASRHTGTIVDE